LSENIRQGLTFDDVLLVPRRSNIQSRRDVDTSTKLSKGLKISVPIISANMDTVTEAPMAIEMARLGGIGLIHRFMSIQQQVSEVLKVKRSESIVIEQPCTISARATVKDAKELLESRNIGGILVTDAEVLKGILTTRDVLFEDDLGRRVSEVMTSKKDLVTATEGTNIEEARRILHKNKVEKLPIVDKDGKLRGLITSQDILKRQRYPFASKDKKGRLRLGASVGVKSDFLQRTSALVEAGADLILVDIAHAHSENSINAITKIRAKFDSVELMAGNVATADGTRDLIDAGVDAVKVGVGSGSICITRQVTGSGVPQLTAIMDCVAAAIDKEIPIVADGGIQSSADLTKALAAGASTVMVGSLLAGTDESPGFPILRNGGRFKVTRGMASLGAALGRREREQGGEDVEEDLTEVVPEGVEALVPYRGRTSEVIARLIGGVRSGMSYCGAKTLVELQSNSIFMRVTESGRKESLPHDVNPVE